jgi:hypothetical protein
MFGWCYPTEGGASRATTRALTTAFGVFRNMLVMLETGGGKCKDCCNKLTSLVPPEELLPLFFGPRDCMGQVGSSHTLAEYVYLPSYVMRPPIIIGGAGGAGPGGPDRC